MSQSELPPPAVQAELDGMDDIYKTLEPNTIYRRWYSRALQRGNSERYAVAAGWGAVHVMTGLNKAETVFYAVYGDAREAGYTQFGSSNYATQVVVQNEDWIQGSGDYRLVVPYTPLER